MGLRKQWGLADEKVAICSLGPWVSTTIDYQGLAGAEFFLHQKQIGLRYIMGFANPANWKTAAHAFIQAFPFCCSHVLPEVRPNDSRRHSIYARHNQ